MNYTDEEIEMFKKQYEEMDAMCKEIKIEMCIESRYRLFDCISSIMNVLSKYKNLRNLSQDEIEEIGYPLECLMNECDYFFCNLDDIETIYEEKKQYEEIDAAGKKQKTEIRIKYCDRLFDCIFSIVNVLSKYRNLENLLPNETAEICDALKNLLNACHSFRCSLGNMQTIDDADDEYDDDFDNEYDEDKKNLMELVDSVETLQREGRYDSAVKMLLPVFISAKIKTEYFLILYELLGKIYFCAGDTERCIQCCKYALGLHKCVLDEIQISDNEFTYERTYDYRITELLGAALLLEDESLTLNYKNGLYHAMLKYSPEDSEETVTIAAFRKKYNVSVDVPMEELAEFSYKSFDLGKAEADMLDEAFKKIDSESVPRSVPWYVRHLKLIVLVAILLFILYVTD